MTIATLAENQLRNQDCGRGAGTYIRTTSLAETLAPRAAGRNAAITVPYASEAGQFLLAGIPAAVCGPGSIDQAHQPGEYIDIAQVQSRISFMRRLAALLSRTALA